MSTTIVFLIKFGSDENIESLLQDGIVYFNTVEFFRGIEDNYTRGDRYECQTSIKQINWLKFAAGGKEFEFKTNSQLYIDDHSNNGNLYCLTAIKKDDIDFSLIDNKPKTYPIRLDPSLSGFGNSALLIHNVPEFVSRIEKALKRKNKKLSYAPVKYVDFNTYEGDLSPFVKSSKYDYQKEFRFFVKHSLNKPYKVKIGNLSDIAIKAKSDEVIYRTAVGISPPTEHI